MKSKLLLLALIVASILIVNAYYPIKDYFPAVLAWFQTLGPWAFIPYVLIFVTSAVFLIPISGMLILAGTLYGFWVGYLLAMFSGLTAGAVTYGLGKKLWRKRVEKLRQENPRFESIYEAISKNGPLLVFLIRLNPLLPFPMLNYLFTIPKLDFRKYLLASFFGMTPDFLFYLYLGYLGKGMLDNSASGLSVANVLVLTGSLTSTIIAALVINRIIKKANSPQKPNS